MRFPRLVDGDNRPGGDAGVRIAGEEIVDTPQEVRLYGLVIVDEYDDIAFRLRHAPVAGVRDALVVFNEIVQRKRGILLLVCPDDVARSVGAIVVDEDNLESVEGELLCPQAVQYHGQVFAPVIRTNHDR